MGMMRDGDDAVSDSFAGLLRGFVLDGDASVHAKTYAKIEELQSDAIKIAAIDGWEHPGTLKMVSDLVDLYTRAQHYHYAELLCARLREGYGRTYPPAHRIQAQVNIKLANTMNSQAMYAAAEETFRKAVGLYDAIGVERTDLELSSALSGLSVSLIEQHKLAGAEEILKQLLMVYRAAFGDSHKDTLGTINRLAQVLELNGKASEAVQLCSASFLLCLETLGEESPITQTAAAALARLKTALGQLDEAEIMYRRAIEITSKSKGPHHISTLCLQQALAEVLVTMSRSDEAGALYHQLLLLFDQHLGPGDLETLALCQRLGELYLSLGDPLAARPFFQRAYDGRCAFFQGDRHPLCCQALFLIGKTYHVECAWRHLPTYRASLARAMELLMDSYRGIVAAVGPCAPAAVEIARYVGNFLVAYEQFAEAESVFDHLYDVYVTRNLFPQDSRARVDVIVQQAVIKEKFRHYRLACDRYVEAQALIAQLRRTGGADLQMLDELDGEVADHFAYARRVRDM